MSEHSSSIAVLLKRLEAATTRLEDLAFRTKKPAPPIPSEVNSTSPSSVPAPLEKSAPSASTVVPPSVTAYDDIINGSFKEFLSLTQSIDSTLLSQVQVLGDLFKAQRELLLISANCAQPKEDVFQNDLLKPLQECIAKISELREANRSSPFFNHLSQVSEGVPAFGWVVVSPAPVGYIGEMKDSAQFYSYRIVKEYKAKDASQIDWSNKLLAIFQELQDYVKEYHKTGLTWNAKGQSVESYRAGSSSGIPPPPPAPPAGFTSPPPPPPPPKSEALSKSSSKSGAPAADMNALFTQINQGEGVTSGLRKVDRSEMTHKNPDLRASNVVPAKSSARPQVGSSAAKAPATVKPPKTQLEGSRWTIENHVDATVTIEITEIKQIVLVANCTNTTVQVKGKFNAIVVDSCKKSGVVIDSAISAVEVINVKSCQVQILGSTPTITVSKSDSLQVYLSEECLNTEVFSSMSVGTLILVPTKVDGQDDFSEKPVPEQFKTTIVNGKLVTVAVDAE